MKERRTFRFSIAAISARSMWLAASITLAGFTQLPAQSSAPIPQNPAEVVLDRVVAVVNRQAILSSDIEDEIQLSVLDPSRAGLGELTPKRALQQLISRALIDQQIRLGDIETAEPTPEEVAARLKSIRTELPACVRANCATDAGWKTFLATHELTAQRVETYLRYRLEILRFIELRFRQGIRISPEEVEAFYRQKLLPLYLPGQTAPPLEQVTPRIQEILLQQQVTALFDGWLDNLRKQGEIEVLDPSLETAETPSPQGAANK
jgi:peptidyl-prolyl cis-trans isomerase SurA